VPVLVHIFLCLMCFSLSLYRYIDIIVIKKKFKETNGVMKSDLPYDFFPFGHVTFT